MTPLRLQTICSHYAVLVLYLREARHDQLHENNNSHIVRWPDTGKRVLWPLDNNILTIQGMPQSHNDKGERVMQPVQIQNKINTLMASKDHMERARAILRVEGYNQFNNDYAALQSAINGVRGDIFGLQTGALPFVKVGE